MSFVSSNGYLLTVPSEPDIEEAERTVTEYVTNPSVMTSVNTDNFPESSLLDPPKMHVPVPPAPNFAAQPMSQALKSGLPPSGAPGTAGSKPALPPIRYSAAVTSSGSATTSSPLVSLNTSVPHPTNTTSPPTATVATPIATSSSQATSSPSISTAGNQDPQPSSPLTSSPSVASSSANRRGRDTPPPLNASSHGSPPHSPSASSTGTTTSGNYLHQLGLKPN